MYWKSSGVIVLSVLSCLFCNATARFRLKKVHSSRYHIEDFVLDGTGYELSYTLSLTNNRQIILKNKIRATILLIDLSEEKYAFLQKDGTGIILEKHNSIAYANFDNYRFRNDFDETPAINFTHITVGIVPEDIDDIVEVNSEHHTLSNILYDFGFNTINILSQPLSLIFSAVREKIESLMDFLRSTAASFLDLTVNGWVDLNSNLWDFLNVFKWIKRFVSAISIPEKDIRLPIDHVLTAKNGIVAFYALLKQLGQHMDLSKVLKGILDSPSKIAGFISGLGGEVLKGITGIFEIIFNITKLLGMIVSRPLQSINSAISSSVNYISNLITSYFVNSPEELSEECSENINDTLSLLDDQDEKYSNEKELAPFRSLLNAARGEETSNIFGIDFSNIFKTLTQPNSTAVNVAVAIFSQIRPVLPFNISFPNLLLNVLQTLNKFIPLKDFESTLLGLNSTNDDNDTSLRSLELEGLKNSELIKQIPRSKAVFEEYEKAVEKYTGSNFADILDEESNVNAKLREELLESSYY